MELTNLKKIVSGTKKRIGRGGGSGKGMHTVGRGQKGQKTRGKIPAWFEGGQLPLIRRTPFLKGKNRFKSLTEKPILVTLDQLNRFDDKAVVDHESLTKVLKISPKRLIWENAKVVGTGKLSKALTIKIPATASATLAIQKAGGILAGRSEA
jgi:large subunit ribosomal protein L15